MCPDLEEEGCGVGNLLDEPHPPALASGAGQQGGLLAGFRIRSSFTRNIRDLREKPVRDQTLEEKKTRNRIRPSENRIRIIPNVYLIKYYQAYYIDTHYP